MLTRRNFLKLCMSSALTVGLSQMLIPFMREAFTQGEFTRPPVIWLELGSCTGNTISLDNAQNPSFLQFITEMVDLRYHWTLNAAIGDQAVRAMLDTVEEDAGRFWLVIEGAVMTGDGGRFNHIFMRNGEMVTGLAALKEFAPKAQHIVAVGDCACFGGPAACHPNPGGAKGVRDVITNKLVINVPGCPAHPDWMTGTFSHLLLYGLPEIDAYNRPTMFFGQTIHELCQRRQQFEDGIFAAFPGDEGCLLKVGCKGPVTHADCPRRQWNHYVSWPVKAGAPCIGCASPHFPDGLMPFFNHLSDIQTPAVTMNVKKIGAVSAALAAGVVGTHIAAGFFSRRIHKNYLYSTKPLEPAPPENLEQANAELDDLIKRQKVLLREVKKLETGRGHGRKKSFLRRIANFWRTDDTAGEDK